LLIKNGDALLINNSFVNGLSLTNSSRCFFPAYFAFGKRGTGITFFYAQNGGFKMDIFMDEVAEKHFFGELDPKCISARI